MVLAAGAMPVMADKRSEAKAQVAFGITVAQKNLWKEALARWTKAVEIDPTYAPAWNDLAIAYEQIGQLDKARQAYDKALEIDPGNATIQQNNSMFRDFYDQQNRRRNK